MRFAGSRSQAVPSPSSSSTSSATQKSIALKMLLPLHDYVNYKLDFPILGSGWLNQGKCSFEVYSCFHAKWSSWESGLVIAYTYIYLFMYRTVNSLQNTQLCDIRQKPPCCNIPVLAGRVREWVFLWKGTISFGLDSVGKASRIWIHGYCGRMVLLLKRLSTSRTSKKILLFVCLLFPRVVNFNAVCVCVCVSLYMCVAPSKYSWISTIWNLQFSTSMKLTHGWCWLVSSSQAKIRLKFCLWHRIRGMNAKTPSLFPALLRLRSKSPKTTYHDQRNLVFWRMNGAKLNPRFRIIWEIYTNLHFLVELQMNADYLIWSNLYHRESLPI